MMHDRLKDEALREAGAALTRALRALHGIEAHDLAADTLRLANRVLQARRALAAPSVTTVTYTTTVA